MARGALALAGLALILLPADSHAQEPERESLADRQEGPRDTETEEEAPETGLYGWVLVQGLGRPVSGALIELVVQRDSVVADSAGYYRIPGLGAGTDSIRVHYLDFHSRPTAIRIEAGAMTQVDLLLTYPTIEVDELVVEVERVRRRSRLAGYDRRRKAGHGRYVTREDIELFRPNKLSDLLITTPGIRPVYFRGRRFIRLRGRTFSDLAAGGAFAGTCQPVMFLNGARAPGLQVDDIFPEMVEGIEIYPGPYVPSVFSTLFTSCGSIAIWTRNLAG